MGWCSGTETFDVAVGAILDNETPTKDKIKKLITAWQGMDWDCEMESAYWDHPIVRQAFKELWPNWFEGEG